MPVTAKLSLAFYEKLGETVANELVDWLNAVDATYRGDLRELNELNFARFDAKVEQRLAALEARLDAKIGQTAARLDAKIDQTAARLDAKIDQLATALDGKLDSQVAAHAFAQIDARFDRLEAAFGAQLATTEARLDAGLQKGLHQNLAWSVVMWISVLAAVVART